MDTRATLHIALGISLLFGSATAAAQDTSRPILRAVRVEAAPSVDGVLDEEVWRGEPLAAGAWLSYNPLHGEPIPQHTRAWVAFDDRYLYVAFQCDDPDPSGIKTSITRRDNIWSDDWVGLSLDALGSGQSSYHLMVNPSGIQLDMINSVSGNEDPSPDYVWDSAGRLNDRGYAVEIRLPLASIRFQGGEDVRMGVLFWRRISRTGVSVAWPALEPGRWVFDKHASLTFQKLESVLTREVIPSVTFSSNEIREAPERWGAADRDGDLGLSARVGLTPTITLDATVNPDFSQVESDAFQVEVNQRFPVFFSEKRPFFMEGAGLFGLAGSGMDSSMIAAVHTRRIVNPRAGIKLTGSAGRVQFGTLTAVDDALDVPGLVPARDRIFNVARMQYSLGPSNYVGAIATDMEAGSQFNRVAGGDLSLRVGANQRITGMLLYSASRDADRAGREGLAASASWSYSTRRQGIAGFFEHYDRGFRMDTAFYNRVGITSGWGYTEWNFYPDGAGKYSWIRRITPFVFAQHGQDRLAGGDETTIVPGVRMNFTRQGFLRIDRIMGHERWQGGRYPLSRPRIQGEVQLFRWMRLSGRADWGAATFYDETAPFRGWSRSTSLDVSWQPTARLSQSIGYRRIDFRRADTREHVYDLDLLNTRTTFQFTKQFFLRGIAQYDSLRARVLADLLASYELRPGTVVHAGYGSLHERRAFVDEVWVPGAGDYLATRRGFFFKTSYLYRF